jgi:hypothetical protein
MDDLDPRPGLICHKLGAERHDLAGEDVRMVEVGLAYQDELAILESVEFEAPGLAVDQEQLFHADFRIKVELLSRAIARADNFHGEVGPPQPMTLLVDRRIPREKDDDIGAAIILSPMVLPIADVRATSNEPKARLADGRFDGITDLGRNFLVLVVREWRHDIDSIPDLVEAVGAGRPPLPDQSPQECGAADQCVHGQCSRGGV